jgi:hypothetical protein
LRKWRWIAIGRARAYGSTTTRQAEAIASDEMARIVRQAIVESYDMDVFDALLAEEEAQRRDLMARLA